MKHFRNGEDQRENMYVGKSGEDETERNLPNGKKNNILKRVVELHYENCIQT